MAEFQRWIDQGGGSLPLFADAHAEDTYCRFSAPAAVGILIVSVIAAACGNASGIGASSAASSHFRRSIA